MHNCSLATPLHVTLKRNHIRSDDEVVIVVGSGGSGSGGAGGAGGAGGETETDVILSRVTQSIGKPPQYKLNEQT